MFYTESGVRLRQRGGATLPFYKYGLVISLIVNLLFVLGILDQSTVVMAFGHIQALVASAN